MEATHQHVPGRRRQPVPRRYFQLDRETRRPEPEDALGSDRHDQGEQVDEEDRAKGEDEPGHVPSVGARATNGSRCRCCWFVDHTGSMTKQLLGVVTSLAILAAACSSDDEAATADTGATTTRKPSTPRAGEPTATADTEVEQRSPSRIGWLRLESAGSHELHHRRWRRSVPRACLRALRLRRLAAAAGDELARPGLRRAPAGSVLRLRNAGRRRGLPRCPPDGCAGPRQHAELVGARPIRRPGPR